MDRRLPSSVRRLIESEPPFVSPVVELELTYLHEVGRVTEPAAAPLSTLQKTIGLGVDDVSVAALVRAAANLSWTRNPFDRMIAAHALIADAPLVTADKTILEHLPLAVWG